MRIIATYQEPRWYHYRKLVGINSFANKADPDGFETKRIIVSNLEQLKEKTFNKTFRSFHGDEGRPMKLSDLSIKIED
jgi:hypothetical protein